MQPDRTKEQLQVEQAATQAAVAATIGMLMNVTQVIAEATTGYHKKLIDGGIASDAAAQMTLLFHAWLMSQMPRS
jgi:hypothetical protein